MTIVGYDDLVEFTAPDGTLTKGAFIVCNTWGETHYAHDRGRYYLPYYFWEQSDRTNSELSRDMCGTDVEYREPKVVFRVKLNYTSRNDLSFRIGVSNKASDNIPVHDYLVPIANYQGGDYPMQGSSGSSEIEFAFDFSSYVQNIHDSEDLSSSSQSAATNVAGNWEPGKCLHSPYVIIVKILHLQRFMCARTLPVKK